jgi:hypothetical protein
VNSTIATSNTEITPKYKSKKEWKTMRWERYKKYLK